VALYVRKKAVLNGSALMRRVFERPVVDLRGKLARDDFGETPFAHGLIRTAGSGPLPQHNARSSFVDLAL
jgi:hypothetical protein